MKINLEQIFKELKAWRDERKITPKSQRQDYIINIMQELGELAAALRDYEKFSKNDCPYCEIDKQIAEHEIIDSICNIAVFSINSWEDEPLTEIEPSVATFNYLLANCAYFEAGYRTRELEQVLITCAYLCEYYGYKFEISILETIKQISSSTGTYDEASKKWIKDESDEARKKWYKADYEKARIKD